MRFLKSLKKTRNSVRRDTTFRPSLEALEQRAVFAVTGPSSSQSPYLIPTHPGVEFTSIMTVGDTVNNKPDGTPYRPVGIMDGLGAFDNGDGTFTLVMNHELPVAINAAGVVTPTGVPRAHGNAGAFVSLWTIDKDTLQVLKVEDLLDDATSIFLSNNDPSTGTVHTGYLAAGTTVMARLCSADLAAETAYAYRDPATGQFYGTTARIFQTGEESGGIATSIGAGGNLGVEGTVHFGRQWNMILTDDPNIPGDQARTAYEMPNCGLFAWENNLANPLSQLKTITAGMDDGSPIGQIYFWVGDKKQTGTVVDRAGLTRVTTNDNLFVLKIPSLTNVDGSGVPLESRTAPVSGPKGSSVPFQLLKSGVDGDASGLTFPQLEADSDSKGATQFLRPEDGQWDPNNPSDYYFVTTDQYDQVKDGVGTTVGRSRLYRMRFTDISNPALGGTIECLLDGTEAGNMFDNMTIDKEGNVLIQEDVGGQDHNSKIWLYDIPTGDLIQLAKHDPARFGDLVDTDNNPATPQAITAATPPFTRDEESSGIIDVSDILGKGTYLLDIQAHYPNGPELVEGGQLLLMNTNVATAKLSAGVLTVGGTVNDDVVEVTKDGKNVIVSFNGDEIGSFKAKDVFSVFIEGHHGNDVLFVEQKVNIPAILRGGGGNDILFGSGDPSILIGDEGSDLLIGRSDSDLLIGGKVTLDNTALLSALFAWSSNKSYNTRVSALRSTFNSSTVLDDLDVDILFGGGSRDWFFQSPGDIVIGRKSNEFIN